MSYKPFVEMVASYRETIGSAYPKQDVMAVIAVFDQCANSPSISQDQICKATALNAGNVNKIISRACEKGWILRDESRTVERTKQLTLTKAGRKLLRVFADRCAASCSAPESAPEKQKQLSLVARNRTRKRKDGDRTSTHSFFEDS